MMSLKTIVAAGALFAAVYSPAAIAQEAPAPGESARVDAIRESGKLRVGVLQNLPWLIENTSGTGDPWSGPGWLIAKEWARLLGVQVEPILMSNESRIPAVQTGQVDAVITGFAVSEERLKVLDYINISSTSLCYVGLMSNPKFGEAKTIDDLNNSDVTIVYNLGGPDKPYLEGRLPNAKLVSFSGGSGEAPIDAVVAGRADATIVNRVLWPWVKKNVQGVGVLPSENDCQDSKEKAAPIGMIINKGDPVLHEWMMAVGERMQPELTAAEEAVLDNVSQ